jgi:hypothetical protein
MVHVWEVGGKGAGVLVVEDVLSTCKVRFLPSWCAVFPATITKAILSTCGSNAVLAAILAHTSSSTVCTVTFSDAT